ncbi:MAG: hypothetical protein JST12_12000 [Armatimonadetes bacterium]|nr:hypothetical protein [Armatimonadota bacterium]
MIRAGSANPILRDLLAKHPDVAEVIDTNCLGIEFVTNRHRFVQPSGAKVELGGVVELMDNNPLVCADSAWVPSPGGALTTLGLGPILEAGLVVEPPAVLLSFEDDEANIVRALTTTGYSGGITFNCENHDLGTVRGAYLIAKIINPASFDEIDDIFDERYGRSFFMRREEEKAWERPLVEGKPWACYRLELTPGEDTSLLAIHVMADIHGKAGEGQFIHTMNVMCGFEESLGLV